VKVCNTLGSGPFSNQIFSIDECKTCGLGFTSPVPTEATSHLLYESRESNDFQPGDLWIIAKLKAMAARRDIRKVFRGIELGEGATVLDYGCGNGAFTRAVQEVYPGVASFGADAHETSPGLGDGSYLSYEQLRASNRRFDMILCRHVLEHTYDPVQTLTFLRSLLAETGVLIIEVPSLQTKVRGLFGKYWDGYYAPFHPLHFTHRSLARVLELAGFEVTREGSAEMPKMGRSLRNAIGCEYGPALFVLGILLQPLQLAIGFFTGTSVCLRAWARPAKL
jgi:SAM-dependent methyltransferase